MANVLDPGVKADREKQIRCLRARGFPHKEIAKRVGLSMSYVSQIARGVKPLNWHGEMPGDEMLELVAKFVFAHMSASGGMAPTRREIGRNVMTKAFKPMSVSMVQHYVLKLVGMGVLRHYSTGDSRALQIVGAKYEVPEFPKALFDQGWEDVAE